MKALIDIKQQFLNDGFAVIDNVLPAREIENLLSVISQAGTSNSNFRKTTDLFAIRQFFKEVLPQ